MSRRLPPSWNIRAASSIEPIQPMRTRSPSGSIVSFFLSGHMSLPPNVCALSQFAIARYRFVNSSHLAMCLDLPLMRPRMMRSVIPQE